MKLQTTFLAIATLAILPWPNPARAGIRAGGTIADCDAASIFGTATLDLNDVAADQDWVTADITPGRVQVPGHTQPSELSGDGIVDSQGHFRKHVFGRIKVLTALLGTPPQGTENYDWSDNAFGNVSQLVAPDFPFISGGTVVCRINPDAQGADRYKPTYLTLARWEKQVAPALAYIQAHKTLFGAGATATADQLAQLQKLESDPNPFLVAQAVRALIAAKHLDAGALAAQAVAARGPRQALLTFLLLHDVPMETRGTAADTLAAAVRTATDAGQVVGIGLGDYAAEYSSGQVGSDAQMVHLMVSLYRMQERLVTTDAPSAAGGKMRNVTTSLPDQLSGSDAQDYLTDVLVLSGTQFLVASPPYDAQTE